MSYKGVDAFVLRYKLFADPRAGSKLSDTRCVLLMIYYLNANEFLWKVQDR